MKLYHKLVVRNDPFDPMQCNGIWVSVSIHIHLNWIQFLDWKQKEVQYVPTSVTRYWKKWSQKLTLGISENMYAHFWTVKLLFSNHVCFQTKNFAKEKAYFVNRESWITICQIFLPRISIGEIFWTLLNIFCPSNIGT